MASVTWAGLEGPERSQCGVRYMLHMFVVVVWWCVEMNIDRLIADAKSNS